jgi:hypothetical protein
MAPASVGFADKAQLPRPHSQQPTYGVKVSFPAGYAGSG